MNCQDQSVKFAIHYHLKCCDKLAMMFHAGGGVSEEVCGRFEFLPDMLIFPFTTLWLLLRARYELHGINQFPCLLAPQLFFEGLCHSNQFDHVQIIAAGRLHFRRFSAHPTFHY